MAMYYYASKISAVACGTRCKQQQQQQQQQQQHQNKQSSRNKDILDNSITTTTILDCDNPDNGDFDKMTKYSDKGSLINLGPQTISGTSKELPEVTCKDAPLNFDISDAALGPNGVMYKNGSVVSGPLDSLIDLIMPVNIDEYDYEYIFSFLLSSRLFIRPHDLLGKLLNVVPDTNSLHRIVELLKVWTKIFPYDFRDERIMNHVKHIASKCADTVLGDEISELLRALLIRLTDLECHEEELRACQNMNTTCVDKKETIEPIRWPSASQLAQLLCRIERKLAKHVGPEEFVQCNENVLNHDRIKSSSRTDSHHSASTSTNVLLPKKTCNLESYLEWSARLRLLVANEILQCTGIRDRSKTVELWSGAAQYCLLVGNYNSATAILESLDTPPITRLQVTWSKLSTTCQQLDCMQRHAEGCGDLWNKQTITTCSNNISSNGLLEKPKIKQVVIATPVTVTTIPSSSSQSSTTSSSTTTASTVKRSKQSSMLKTSTTSSSLTKSPNEWVVIPIFSDIVRLALNVREDCSTILPNGHINMAAFDRLAAIVGAFTRHMSEVNQTLPDVGEYETLCQYMQSCSLISESDLMLASFDCEEPTLAEKKEYGVA